MKVTVTSPFTDKYSRRRYEAGDVYEGTAERIAELSARNLVEVKEKVEQVATKEKKEVKPTAKVKK